MPRDPRPSPLRLAVMSATLTSPLMALACAERPAPPPAPKRDPALVHPVFVLEHGRAIPAPTEEPRLEVPR